MNDASISLAVWKPSSLSRLQTIHSFLSHRLLSTVFPPTGEKWWGEGCHQDHSQLRGFTFIQEVFLPTLTLQLCKKKKLMKIQTMNIIRGNKLINLSRGTLLFSVAQSCPSLCDPMDCSTPASLTFTISWSLLKFMSTESVMSSM